MVYISPGVQVIEDYDQPVFYSSSFYWHYNDGVWYQSRSYTGGWVRVTAAPAAIVRIQQPSMYVHYHASARGDAPALGGQVKSGQLWTGQIRPVAPGRVRVAPDRSVLQVAA